MAPKRTYIPSPTKPFSSANEAYCGCYQVNTINFIHYSKRVCHYFMTHPLFFGMLGMSLF